MADRTLVVSLRAKAAQFRAVVIDAAGAADRAGAAAEGAGRTASVIRPAGGGRQLENLQCSPA